MSDVFYDHFRHQFDWFSTGDGLEFALMIPIAMCLVGAGCFFLAARTLEQDRCATVYSWVVICKRSSQDASHGGDAAKRREHQRIAAVALISPFHEVQSALHINPVRDTKHRLVDGR